MFLKSGKYIVEKTIQGIAQGIEQTKTEDSMSFELFCHASERIAATFNSNSSSDITWMDL